MPIEMRSLAERWIEAQEGPETLRELDAINWPPIEEVLDFSYYPAESDDQTEKLWMFITTVYLLNPSESTLKMLGAGPLEELVTYWGGKYIERIEDFVKENPGFKKVMQNVWFSSNEAEKNSSKEVYSRFFELAEIEPNFK